MKYIQNFDKYLNYSFLHNYKCKAFNYTGVVLTAISGLFFVFIKNETNAASEERTNLINNDQNEIIEEEVASSPADQSQVTFLDNINPNLKRIVGISLACGSGKSIK